MSDLTPASVTPASEELVETVRAERRVVALPITAYQLQYSNRDKAMAHAYFSTAFTMPQIVSAFGVSTKTVSRAVAAFDKASLEDYGRGRV